jgi:hypothetical protein
LDNSDNENSFDTSTRNNELIWSSECSLEQPTVYINSEFNQSPETANSQFGTQYRTPGLSLVKLDITQSSATDTSQDAPGYAAVTPGTYFSDDLHKNFWNDSESLRSYAAN